MADQNPSAMGRVLLAHPQLRARVSPAVASALVGRVRLLRCAVSEECMTLEELDDVIAEVEAWHHIRSELNRNPKRKALDCSLLPKVLVALREYRERMV